MASTYLPLSVCRRAFVYLSRGYAAAATLVTFRRPMPIVLVAWRILKRPRRGFATCAAVTILALIVGCAGGDSERIEVRELRRLVLQPSDLPATFERFDYGALTLNDANPGPRSDPSRFEREGGWKARYKQAGSPATAGPLIVESKLDAFEDERGAERDLAAYAQEFDQAVAAAAGRAKLVRPPTIGDGAIAITTEQASGVNRVLFFTVVWRRANVSALIGVTGFGGKVSLADAVSLARKQDGRIERAAGTR